MATYKKQRKGALSLRGEMERRGIDDSALAALFGVSQSTVRDWKSGYHRPHPLTQARIERLLGIQQEHWYESADPAERKEGAAA